jgi:predicted Zn-dependent peptidase
MSERITTLANGVRVVTIKIWDVSSVSVGVFVRTGSRNESKALNGVSHALEHMAYKGTETRSCRDIAVTAERLGAACNAYTSKDTTAYYMHGLSKHAPVFVELLADMMQNNIFPQEELEREREVISQEFHMYEDDANATAFDLIDIASYGKNTPLGRTILGPLKNIKRFTREDLLGYMHQHYHGDNMIVGVAGGVDHDEAVRMVEDFFGDVKKTPKDYSNFIETPVYKGGVAIKRRAAFTQSTVLMAFPVESLRGHYHADLVLGELLGSGVSSPLFEEIREKRGLCYGVSSTTHLMDTSGQLLISASTTQEHLKEYFVATCNVLKRVADKITPVDLERAINMINVATVREQESIFRRLENSAENVFLYGTLPDVLSEIHSIEEVTADQVRERLCLMLTKNPSLALVGKGSDESLFTLLKEAIK